MQKLTLSILLLFFSANIFLANTALADSIATLTENAKQQDPQSQYLLAQSYDLGVDVEQDKTNAFYWYSQAANNEQIDAQKKVAYFLANGIGTKQNIPEAIRWYSQLAMKGNPQAPLQLAKLYEKHSGSMTSLDLAEVWYQIASELDPAAEDGYNRVLEAKFNARRAKQMSSIEQLDVEFSEKESKALPSSSDDSTLNFNQFSIVDYLSAGLLVLLIAALIVAVKKIRIHKSNKKTEQNQQLHDQLKNNQFTIKQQKRQMEAMFREVKKHQASQKNHKLNIACALFGFTANTIPHPKQIKARYKQLSKIYHPDLQGSDQEMKHLNVALKAILANVAKK